MSSKQIDHQNTNTGAVEETQTLPFDGQGVLVEVDSNNKSSGDSTTKTEQRPLSKDELLQLVLNCNELFIDNAEWFYLMQEEPKLLSPSRNNRAKNGYWKPNKNSTNPDAHKYQFKLLCQAAEIFFSRVSTKPEFFDMGSKSTSAMIRTICNWIYQERNLKSEQKSAISYRSHPEFWDYVKGDDNNSTHIYYLVSQKKIIEKAVGASWGITIDVAKKFEASDLVRLAGLLVHSNFRSRVNFLTDGRRSRVENDNRPSFNKSQIFHDIADAYNNKSTVVLNPPQWQHVIDLHGTLAENIDANDPERIDLGWTAENMKTMYEHISKQYKETMKKWTSGTGGGSGAPEDYQNWEEQDPAEYFNSYACNIGAGLYLTWVYMVDKNAGFILFAKYQGMPQEASLEFGVNLDKGNEEDYMTPIHNSNNKNKKRKATSSTDEYSDHSKKLISFTETAMEKLTSQLATEQKDTDKDMAVSEKRNKISTFISSMDEEIDKKEKEIKALKKIKTKRKEMTLSKKKEKEYSGKLYRLKTQLEALEFAQDENYSHLKKLRSKTRSPSVQLELSSSSDDNSDSVEEDGDSESDCDHSSK